MCYFHYFFKVLEKRTILEKNEKVPKIGIQGLKHLNSYLFSCSGSTAHTEGPWLFTV